MPNPAALIGNEAPPQSSPDQPIELNPFVRAAREVRRSFDTRQVQLDASSHPQGPISVPPLGYLREIILIVTTSTSGSGGSAAAAGDAPWTALTNISLEDVNGRPIVGPLNGYQLYLINKWGGYTFKEYDPADLPSYSAINATTGDFAFKLRIPVEITPRDGYGSLPNLTQAATYKLFYTVADETGIYSTSPATTLPEIQIEAILVAWSQPPPTAADGTPNATVPPGFGTTQFWSVASVPITAGENRVTFPRMGNHIRNWLLVFYNDAATPVRISTEFPTTWRLEWDQKIADTTSQTLEADIAVERWKQTLDTGVFVIDFTHDADGTPGNENRHLWLPTVSGTRFDLIGTWTGTGGTLYILTNDVAVRGKVQLSSGYRAN